MKQLAFCVSHLAMLSKLFRWSGAHRSLFWVAELPGRCLVTCCRSTQPRIACTVGLETGGLWVYLRTFASPGIARARGCRGASGPGHAGEFVPFPAVTLGGSALPCVGLHPAQGSSKEQHTSRRMLGSGAGRTSVTKLWGWCSQCCSCKNLGEQKKEKISHS